MSEEGGVMADSGIKVTETEEDHRAGCCQFYLDMDLIRVVRPSAKDMEERDPSGLFPFGQSYIAGSDESRVAHLKKQRETFREHNRRGEEAEAKRLWHVAAEEYNMCCATLEAETAAITEANHQDLLWACAPLVFVEQAVLKRRYDRCVELLDKAISCLKRSDGPFDVIRRVVLYSWGRKLEDIGGDDGGGKEKIERAAEILGLVDHNGGALVGSSARAYLCHLLQAQQQEVVGDVSAALRWMAEKKRWLQEAGQGSLHRMTLLEGYVLDAQVLNTVGRAQDSEQMLLKVTALVEACDSRTPAQDDIYAKALLQLTMEWPERYPWEELAFKLKGSGILQQVLRTISERRSFLSIRFLADADVKNGPVRQEAELRAAFDDFDECFGLVAGQAARQNLFYHIGPICYHSMYYCAEMIEDRNAKLKLLERSLERGEQHLAWMESQNTAATLCNKAGVHLLVGEAAYGVAEVADELGLGDRPGKGYVDELGHGLSRQWQVVFCHLRRSMKLYSEFLYNLQFEGLAVSIVPYLEQHSATSSACLLVQMLLNKRRKFLNRGMMDDDGEAWLTDALDRLSRQQLLWAERSLSNELIFRLLPSARLSSISSQTLHQFSLDDEVAWDALRNSQAACGEGTVFVEYYLFGREVPIGRNFTLTINVVAQDGKYQTISGHNTEPVCHCFGCSKTMPEIVTYMRDVLSNKDKYVEEKARLMKLLHTLYILLIAPIAKTLESMLPEHKLVICPPQELSGLPFALLLDHQGKFLIESHTISVTPSLRVLHLCDQRLRDLLELPLMPGAAASVALGDPFYTKNSGLEKLEAAGEEVDYIVRLFGDNHVEQFKGSRATALNLLQCASLPSTQPGKGCHQAFIHVAAHGCVNNSNKQGALALAVDPKQRRLGTSRRKGHRLPNRGVDWTDEGSGADSEDITGVSEELDNSAGCIQELTENFMSLPGRGEIGGIDFRRSAPSSNFFFEGGFLRSEDIMNCGFDWRALIVVLSACETATGEVWAEDVLNLPRAFMLAGVPSIVASLWEVNDASTLELMKGFYSSWKEGNDVASALRSAMLHLLDQEDYRDPYHWGSFLVWGLPTVCASPQLYCS